MQSNLLVDSIVRQTTVQIAQLSTAAGLRAPFVSNVVIPLAASRGWQATCFDHFSTVCRALVSKLQQRGTPELDNDDTEQPTNTPNNEEVA